LTIIENRHHENRVPVYASTFWNDKKQVYKDSVRKVIDHYPKKSIAEINGRTIGYNWLKGAAETYNLSPDIKDYLIFEIPAVTIDIPNRNMHCFPYEEISYFDPRFGKFIYETFVGKPSFVDHCFIAGTKVRISNYDEKNIEDLVVGDLVLTHNMRLRKVVDVIRNGIKGTKRIKVQGILEPLYVTDNHPLYIVDRRQVFGSYHKTRQTNQARLRKENFRDIEYKPHWRPISDIYDGDYACIPIEYGGDIVADPNLAFLTGAYLADGCLQNKSYKVPDGYSVLYTIGHHEIEFREALIKAATELGYKYSYAELRRPGCDWITIHSKELASFVRNTCGEYSEAKRLKGEVRKWCKDSTLIMLGAYTSGDGSFDRKKGSFRCRTSSIDLLKDLQQAFAFTGIPACVGIDFIAANHIDEKPMVGDQEIKTRRDSGYIRINQRFAKQLAPFVVGKNIPDIESKVDSASGIIMDNYLLMPILSIEDAGEQEVFNIEVEEDHSYIAGGVVAHNCNKNPIEAKGIHFDAMLRKVPGWDVWKIYTLVGFDRTKDPALVKRMERGERRSFSMGCWVSYFLSSITGQIENGSQALKYPKGTVHEGMLSYLQCVGCDFFEQSSVEGPADVTAESHQLWYF